MADATYSPKVYMTDGGNEQVVASGGKQTVESGGQVDFESGSSLKLAGTAVTATAAQLNTTKIESQSVLFTEAGAGTYTGGVTVPAGSVIVDIIVHAIALWDAATSAALDVGDFTTAGVAIDANGYFAAVDLKATDLLAAESISFAQTGAKEGADLDDPAAGAHVRRRYLSTARVVTGVVTSVGAGTAGRTLMTVVYTTPVAAAAVKS
jgi:hypothetical protein